MLSSFRAVHLSPKPTRNGPRKRLKLESVRNKTDARDEITMAYAMLDFVGDKILQALGTRLLGCVRATDHVCRHGGDEFVVLLSDLAEHEQAFAVVDKVRESAAELLRQQGHWATLTVSVGISLFPNDGETLEALLPHADTAMYRVKTEAKRVLVDHRP